MSPITIGDERDAPPIFAGRDDELAKLQSSLDHIQQTGSSCGGLVLVTGVPGIGKTSLVRRFAETCGAKRLIGGVSDLADPVDLFLSIGAAIDRESDFEKIAGVKIMHHGRRCERQRRGHRFREGELHAGACTTSS